MFVYLYCILYLFYIICCIKKELSIFAFLFLYCRSHLNVANGGVNGFDFDKNSNLIATANQSTLVNLFNPYVNEPSGVLKGHSRVVLAVRFMSTRGQLISIAEDKILRIWNVSLQICIQRIANAFSKGVEGSLIIINFV
jgi:WD40 repeat protein